MYSSRRNARFMTSGGNRLDFPSMYNDAVCLSAKLLIMGHSVMRNVTQVKGLFFLFTRNYPCCSNPQQLPNQGDGVPFYEIGPVGKALGTFLGKLWGRS